MRYMIASISPHARLQPIAPTSIARISARPDSAALSDPVKVRTMISPKRTSETRSIGSSARFGPLSPAPSDHWLSRPFLVHPLLHDARRTPRRPAPSAQNELPATT